MKYSSKIYMHTTKLWHHTMFVISFLIINVVSLVKIKYLIDTVVIIEFSIWDTTKNYSDLMPWNLSNCEKKDGYHLSVRTEPGIYIEEAKICINKF